MRNQGRYVKAMVLLTVFSMNTVMSFACSLSSFVHSFHHSITSAEQQPGLHHHAHEATSHHHGEEQPSADQEDCCSGDMVQVEKADKSPGRYIQLPLPQFQPYLFPYATEQVYFSLRPAGQPWADAWRWRPPSTIQDLRIVIQSFQI